jgi:hypothetical protein
VARAAETNFRRSVMRLPFIGHPCDGDRPAGATVSEGPPRASSFPGVDASGAPEQMLAAVAAAIDLNSLIGPQVGDQ